MCSRFLWEKPGQRGIGLNARWGDTCLITTLPPSDSRWWNRHHLCSSFAKCVDLKFLVQLNAHSQVRSNFFFFFKLLIIVCSLFDIWHYSFFIGAKQSLREELPFMCLLCVPLTEVSSIFPNVFLGCRDRDDLGQSIFTYCVCETFFKPWRHFLWFWAVQK